MDLQPTSSGRDMRTVTAVALWEPLRTAAERPTPARDSVSPGQRQPGCRHEARVSRRGWCRLSLGCARSPDQSMRTGESRYAPLRDAFAACPCTCKSDSFHSAHTPVKRGAVAHSSGSVHQSIIITASSKHPQEHQYGSSHAPPRSAPAGVRVLPAPPDTRTRSRTRRAPGAAGSSRSPWPCRAR